MHCVRRVPTEWGDACARSLPERVVRTAVWTWGPRLALRKAVRRFVRRREGVGEEGCWLGIVGGGVVVVVVRCAISRADFGGDLGGEGGYNESGKL